MERILRLMFAGLALVPLAACTLAQSDATAPGSLPGTCRNDALAQFTGRQASQSLGAAIMRAAGARTIRWVPYGSMVTMEFSPERVTVYLDSSNRVERAGCG